jgi:hypothetical protein
MAAGHVLTVGDRVRVSGGYDYQPDWLAGGTGYTGTVVAFIPGQNEREAAVVRFDEKLVLADAEGQYAVLELGHVGSSWATAQPRIHIELCDFEPAARRWQDRRQGAWVESHATYEVLPGPG